MSKDFLLLLKTFYLVIDRVFFPTFNPVAGFHLVNYSYAIPAKVLVDHINTITWFSNQFIKY